MKRGRAFTLLEMLISISILSVIAYVTAVSFVSIKKATEWSSDNDKIRRSIDRLVDKMDNELSSLIFITTNKRTRFSSERKDYGDIKYNNIRFACIEPINIYETVKRDEVVETDYQFVFDSEVEKIKMVKRQWYLSKTPDKQSVDKPDVKLEMDVKFDYFIFSFYKRGKWYDNWDTDKMKDLPDLIRADFSVNGVQYRVIFNVNISRL